MSSLPYLATLAVLIAISRRRGFAGSGAPASLGIVFVPDRSNGRFKFAPFIFWGIGPILVKLSFARA
jgi:hypothetical protein